MIAVWKQATYCLSVQTCQNFQIAFNKCTNCFFNEEYTVQRTCEFWKSRISPAKTSTRFPLPEQASRYVTVVHSSISVESFQSNMEKRRISETQLAALRENKLLL